jgi:hypothetical protein
MCEILTATIRVYFWLGLNVWEMHQTLDVIEVKRLVEKESYTLWTKKKKMKFSVSLLRQRVKSYWAAIFQKCDYH